MASFRRRYEVCEKWDTLRWVAQCTLRRGSVVVIGPGQSVSAQTCEKPGESYPANRFYVHEKVHDEFAKKLTAKMAGLKMGNGLDDGVNLGRWSTKTAATR